MILTISKKRFHRYFFFNASLNCFSYRGILRNNNCLHGPKRRSKASTSRTRKQRSRSQSRSHTRGGKKATSFRGNENTLLWFYYYCKSQTRCRVKTKYLHARPSGGYSIPYCDFYQKKKSSVRCKSISKFASH